MESKIQSTIFIGDENDNKNDENEEGEDIFETIFNEMKENLKSVDEAEKKKEETNETNEKDDEKEKNDELDDFVIIENTDEKKEDELKALNVNQMKMISEFSLRKKLEFYYKLYYIKK